MVEKVPWAESASRYTFPMEGLVAYHAQKTDHTTVAALMRIAWRTASNSGTLGRIVYFAVTWNFSSEELKAALDFGVSTIAVPRTPARRERGESLPAGSSQHTEKREYDGRRHRTRAFVPRAPTIRHGK